MALPKEPRQKMINLMYLVLTALLALNVSAEVLEAFKTVDKSLMTSNSNIEKSNATLFESLKDKQTDPNTDKTKLAKWSPAADKAKALSDEFTQYLDALKDELKVASGKTTKDGKEEFKEDDLNASSRIFDTQKKGKDLDDKLKKYKSDMLAIDPEIQKQFENSFPVEVDGSKDATTPNFRMMPTVAAITLLSKYQNNIKNAENQVVTFCHNQLGKVEVHMDKVSVLVGQSSSYLMPGESLEIKAGVGAYSSAAAPRISINGSSVAVTDGQGSYKTEVSGAGEHSVAVNVVFKDENGVEQTKTETVKYTVGQPSSASVTLDKMDVFYIGLDNPITIGSPTGMEKTSVTASGCTLGGSGAKRTVSVTTPGTCTITVSPAGSAAFTHTYRIKRIPEPEFKVGSGKPRMTSVEFKSQTFCRADMGPEFIYDVKYNIVSATVYFGGAGFQNVATGSISGGSLAGISALMARCMPGTSIAFDNVKVQGPDGVRAIEGKTIQLF